MTAKGICLFLTLLDRMRMILVLIGKKKNVIFYNVLSSIAEFLITKNTIQDISPLLFIFYNNLFSQMPILIKESQTSNPPPKP